jgi:hypothetical protein
MQRQQQSKARTASSISDKSLLFLLMLQADWLAQNKREKIQIYAGRR